MEGSGSNLSRNKTERGIPVSGDCEAIVHVIEAVKGTVETFKTGITLLKISLLTCQHRLLTGEAVNKIIPRAIVWLSHPLPMIPEIGRAHV